MNSPDASPSSRANMRRKKFLDNRARCSVLTLAINNIREDKPVKTGKKPKRKNSYGSMSTYKFSANKRKQSVMIGKNKIHHINAKPLWQQMSLKKVPDGMMDPDMLNKISEQYSSSSTTSSIIDSSASVSDPSPSPRHNNKLKLIRKLLTGDHSVFKKNQKCRNINNRYFDTLRTEGNMNQNHRQFMTQSK